MHNRHDDKLDGYEWDPAKARRNRAKHDVAFLDAVAALEDSHAITLEAQIGDEVRHKTLGRDALARLVVVVWTWRGRRARIISARRATLSERASYRWLK